MIVWILRMINTLQLNPSLMIYAVRQGHPLVVLHRGNHTWPVRALIDTALFVRKSDDQPDYPPSMLSDDGEFMTTASTR